MYSFMVYNPVELQTYTSNSPKFKNYFCPLLGFGGGVVFEFCFVFLGGGGLGWFDWVCLGVVWLVCLLGFFCLFVLFGCLFVFIYIVGISRTWCWNKLDRGKLTADLSRMNCSWYFFFFFSTNWRLVVQQKT